MKARNLTQTALAEVAGMKHPYVNRVLQGHTTPSLDQCERLAKAVGMPLHALLGNAEDFAESVLTALTD